MTIISVTATITYDYDTDDGIIATVEEAVDDIADMIDGGQVRFNQFTITTREVVKDS